MRTIKFRIWDNNKKRLETEYDDLLIDQDGDIKQFITSGYEPYLANIDNDSLIIEQFTGLKDSNEVEIYEGDIVEFRANYSSNPCGYMKAKVVITEYRLELHSENGCVYDANEETDEFPYAKCKVLGNIHKNKNLLKL